MNAKTLSYRFIAGAGTMFGAVLMLTILAIGPAVSNVFSPAGKTHAQGVSKQVSTPSNFQLHLGTGIMGASMPYDTDVFEDIHGPVPGLDVFITITRPDSTTVSYQQQTDNEGRIRGQVYASVLNQKGTYTIAITGPPAIAGVSGTFVVHQYQDAP